jgi:replicative DNA helicase
MVKAEDFGQFSKVSRELNAIPLWLDDTAALSFDVLRKKARRLHRLHGIGIIIIDYLQLLNNHQKNRNYENRVQELSEITRGLKALAKELNIPVLALSQLSRAVEQREDKQPMLSDLRESGTIEQDSDVVMFIYRAEYYASRAQPPEGSEKMAAWQKEMQEVHGKADIIIAKQRHGPIGHVPVVFDAQRTKFGDL